MLEKIKKLFKRKKNLNTRKCSIPYNFNYNKIKTVKDIRIIFKQMTLTFWRKLDGKNDKDFKEAKHMLVMPKLTVSKKKGKKNVRKKKSSTKKK